MNGLRLKRYIRCVVSGTAILILTGHFAPAVAEQTRFLNESFPNGFKRQGSVRFYNSGNLFEYINGQAVFYLSYGFKILEHGVYRKEGKEYTVDVYELNSRLSAFGAYRQQRDEDAADLDAGCEGSIIDYLTVFYKGNYYVEIIPTTTESEDVETMRTLAGHVVANVPGESELPPEVTLFPKEHLIPGSERYVDENLLSYSVMGRGLTARYDQGSDSELRVFLALPDNNEEALKVYNGFNGKIKNSSLAKLEEAQGIKGETPYRGMAIMYIRDRYVFGCLSIKDEGAANRVLTGLYDMLKKKRLVQ